MGGCPTDAAGRDRSEETHFVGNDEVVKDVGMKYDWAFWTSGLESRVEDGGSEGDRVGGSGECISCGSIQSNSLDGYLGLRVDLGSCEGGCGVGVREVLALVEAWKYIGSSS